MMSIPEDHLSAATTGNNTAVATDSDDADEDNTNTTRDGGDRHLEEEVEDFHKTLAAKETVAVRRLRVVILVVLLAVAVLASVGIYYYSLSTEKREFENAFGSQGLKVISGFQGDSFRKLQAMESLSNSFTSYSKVSGEQWPFVTIPDSAKHFEPYLSLTNAVSLLLMPMVGPRQRNQWERYAVSKQGWIEQDLQGMNSSKRALLEQQAQEFNNEDDQLPQLQQNKNISRYIRNYVGIDTSPNPWVVWWQYAPVIPNRFFVNFNRMAWEGFDREVQAVKQGRAVLSKTWAFQPGLDLQSTKDFEFTKQLLRAGRQGSYEYQSGEPIGYIHYPVFDPTDYETTVVAVLTATVYWRTYMQDLLPESENMGLVCVVENSHGQAYTYQINGPQADFLGPGDLSDPDYANQRISADYTSFADNEKAGWYTGVPVDTDYVSYKIHIYPSKEFEESYLTEKPTLYATAIILVFLVTCSIFILYDWYVQRRQRIVMASAATTNAVVESLFPSTVRRQVMDNHASVGVQNKKEKEGSVFNNTSRHNNKRDSDAEDIIPAIKGNKKNESIADEYPETTIFFADLVGFTSWSSKRTPNEVFELLEALYGRMDKIAKRRRVFKVETIGDCYVAATGIPHPSKKHALNMARFASECISEMHLVSTDMASKLGEDTKELEMRIGLHSGSTTGGVLRGDKGRFQLFGDTVNTASRMESNGLPSKIHCSQATADYLIAAGKDSWLVQREDKIEAKGKGLMTTYFVTVPGSKTASVGTTDSRFSFVTSTWSNDFAAQACSDGQASNDGRRDDPECPLDVST